MGQAKKMGCLFRMAAHSRFENGLATVIVYRSGQLRWKLN
jgi:hypothetical protein